jgi:DNA-binding transcriptional LysR family regulator
VGVYLLPLVLAEFRRRYPAVEVTLDISLSERIEAKLLTNELDLGLVSYDARDSRLLTRAFMTDELIAIAPPDHPWATRRRIKPQDLAEETFIMAAQGAGTRAVVEERLKVQGIVLANVLDFGNLEGVKHAVEAGLGVSIQAKSVVQRELAAGSLRGIRLTGMEASIQFFYASRKNAHLSNAAKALVALLTESGTDSGAPTKVS